MPALSSIYKAGLFYMQKTWTDVFPKKMYGWPAGTRKGKHCRNQAGPGPRNLDFNRTRERPGRQPVPAPGHSFLNPVLYQEALLFQFHPFFPSSLKTSRISCPLISWPVHRRADHRIHDRKGCWGWDPTAPSPASQWWNVGHQWRASRKSFFFFF